MITGHTAVYAVIGDPIRQSLSPVIHNHWISAAGIDAVYTALHVQGDSVEQDIQALFRAGVSGLNVTAPHKLPALEAAIARSEDALVIGAANTLARNKEGWRAANTDVDGFLLALRAAHGAHDLTGKRVLVIGAGGAARAVVYGLHREGAISIIANRTVERAYTLAETLAPTAQIIGLERLADAMDAVDIVVNASSLGHQSGEGESGLDLSPGRDRLFYDLTYGPAARGLLGRAAQAGWRTEDGLRMLVEQARVAFRIWHGVDPDPQSALELCRKTLEARS